MKAKLGLFILIWSNLAFATPNVPFSIKSSHPKNNKLKIQLEAEQKLSALHSNLHVEMKLDYSERILKNKAHLELDAKLENKNHYFIHLKADVESNVGFDQEAEASLSFGKDFEFFHKLHLAPEAHITHLQNMYLFDVSVMFSTTL
jgi:hypothetical protein